MLRMSVLKSPRNFLKGFLQTGRSGYGQAGRLSPPGKDDDKRKRKQGDEDATHRITCKRQWMEVCWLSVGFYMKT